MITRRTRIQLFVFALITLLGCSYVGATYAQLDRFFRDTSYEVVAHFADSGGGIFAGGQVTYRGVPVGRVDELTLTDDGVDVHLQIDKDKDTIPADTLAVVANASAVGEQYVDLQPQSKGEPYLEDGSEIDTADTAVPIATEKLLGDVARTVSSVDRDALRTTVSELGTAFGGSGEDLSRILDDGGDFIQKADDNFQVTTDLIRDANTVLKGQLASEDDIRTFARQLRLFTRTLAGADPDLRRVIDEGGSTARVLRTFLEDNGVELGDLINNLVTTGRVVRRHLDGVEQLLVIYPYVVEGGFTVVSKSPTTGLYDAHFGLIITDTAMCHEGYEGTRVRTPAQRGNREMNTDARCTEAPTQSNPRGAQNIYPRAAADYDPDDVVASYDPDTGDLTWGGVPADGTDASTAVPDTLAGNASWLWLDPLGAGSGGQG
ncbi:MlaD family protein [Nocardioides sp. GY 10127]|uniref:MCE family protein n=1 Tax=Nocardioides sp. GY 10127 TaxID=2569762 RepID=UPI0010A7DE20|nr:MlaD family protein [Nocardioides sp. GY 10127]TIC79945.1 MCE family protein [Nocardioides sp. GY 10127]